MGKAEIKRKFDEIVNFAEVERFLDTPVKRYSSGMYVRLAFAVAAHLSTDILIVDEVLAVGDAEFQKKCLTKMSELGQRENRTVIFVSHALDAISRLTNRCLVLKAGQLIFNGETSDGIKHYKDQTIIKSDNHIYENSSKKKGVVIIKCYDGNWIETERIINGECYYFEFIVRVDAIARRPIFSFQLICNTNEQPRMHAWNFEIDDAYKPGEDYKLLCKIPKIRLSKGSYNIQTWFSDHAAGHIIENMQAVGEVIVDMPSERPLFPWNVDSMAYLEEFVWLKQGNESE
jgi:lipopolysaccharide transport system ATP-binding protein